MAECRTLGQGAAAKMLQGLATTLKTIHIKDRYSICTLGCRGFGFFHILRYNNPSLTPYGPKELEIGQKNFSSNFSTRKCVIS
jgi:hypothetical protein